MKLALGMMVKDFVSAEVLLAFLDNAQRHGHRVDRVLLAWSHSRDAQAARQLEERVAVSWIQTNHYCRGEEELARLGLAAEQRRSLLHCSLLEEHGLVPYGFNRDLILLEALFTGMDVLVFVDSDVYPYVLQKSETAGGVEKRDIDFFGLHLNALKKGAQVSTSDYSGYHILPPAVFPGQEELLYGLHKEDLADFWEHSGEHYCLSLQHPGPSRSRPTRKLLGGNLALTTAALQHLPPFFSPAYLSGGQVYLARGEDTFWGLAVAGEKVRCVDIDTHIFHDTYGTYPACPELRTSPAVRDRLYYACTGWIGRNVFLGGKLGMFSSGEEGERAQALQVGARALANYTQDPRFLRLPEHRLHARQALPQMLRQCEAVEEAWAYLQRRFFT